MLARWRTVWSELQAEGILPRNVVALVQPLRKPSNEPVMKTDDSLTETEIETLLVAHTPAAEDAHARRREVLLHLALLGLRRGELAGLRWSAVDLDAETPTITVQATRSPSRIRRRCSRINPKSRLLVDESDDWPAAAFRSTRATSSSRPSGSSTNFTRHLRAIPVNCAKRFSGCSDVSCPMSWSGITSTSVDHQAEESGDEGLT